MGNPHINIVFFGVPSGKCSLGQDTEESQERGGGPVEEWRGCKGGWSFRPNLIKHRPLVEMGEDKTKSWKKN